MRLISILIFSMFAVSCKNDTDSVEFKKCLENGTSYYKRLCLYPHYHGGEDTKKIIEKKCLDDANVFDIADETKLKYDDCPFRINF